LLLRKYCRGRGAAGAAGFKKSLEFNPDFILEMDADFSHNPIFIRQMIEKIQNNDIDVVLGSRYMPGGKDIERGFHRRIISFLARKYLIFVLGLKVSDPTTGYRIYRKKVIEQIVHKLTSSDPFTVTEVLFICHKHAFKISEIPIEFEDRKKGISKLNFFILIKYIWRVIYLRFSINDLALKKERFSE
ncbi:MAG: glycosyltransferase, partial [Oligoflexia bacterium]|nr:glycosyltransferase [Oligoflexia bacterium]